MNIRALLTGRLVLAIPSLFIMTLFACTFASTGSATEFQDGQLSGSISGKVTNALDGHPLQGVHVAATVFVGDYSWSLITTVETDAGGFYTLADLPVATGPPPPPQPLWMGSVWDPSGYYFISAYTDDGSYAPVSYGNYVAITSPGQSVSGIDMAMTPTCSGAAPDLRLIVGDIYWGSYADYQARRLSVAYTIADAGTSRAVNVKITGASNSNGVTLTTAVPSFQGYLGLGGNLQTTLVYDVPEGVSWFQTSVHATAEDPCGNQFVYPPAD